MISIMEISDLIRTERIARGWSQRALASALRVSPGAVAQWELGRTRPKLARMMDICTLFGLPAQSLFSKGSPYLGELIQDARELELVAMWRRLSTTEQGVALRMLRAAFPAADGEAPASPPASLRTAETVLRG
jgi:transcriptional regulator with XRE-family HTH domain